jgi:hypothetical protein
MDTLLVLHTMPYHREDILFMVAIKTKAMFMGPWTGGTAVGKGPRGT